MGIEEEVTGRYRNEYHKGAINLVYTVKQFSYGFLQMLRTHSITEPQYNILKVLRGFRSEGPFSIGFLKARMLDKNSDVSRLVDKLYEKGYIDRKENPADRRQKEVEITQKGLDLLAGMDDCDDKTDSLLKNLTLEEVQELNRLLDKIRN
jgi:MarR family transcriptional regulator, multiple gene regulator MgrA